MKNAFFSKRPAQDPMLTVLQNELRAAQGELSLAYRQFDLATDPELVESCIFQRSQSPVQLPDPHDQGSLPRHGGDGKDGGGRHMDLSQKIMVGLLAVFLLAALLRIFKAPLRLALKLLINTLLGFLALYLVGLTAPWTGITLGLNLWNALIVGILGLPGFVLLLLVQWIL